MQKSNVMLSRQSLEQILESLNNIQAFILSLQLTISNPNTAIDHMIYFHDMFKPDVLQVFRKVTKLQSQLAALVCTIQDLPLARLYESATAPGVSCQRLKRFNTTKAKKGELVVSA
jgi:hypothetical protein|uniref:hypothetical protein n=1 Tax=Succinivibrio sp. TaxID=2053619 RepID=UPI00402A7FD5